MSEQNADQQSAAEKLRAISKALVRRVQLQNWKKELADKMETLQRQLAAAELEEEEIEEVLSASPDLTTVAQELMGKAAELKGAGDDELSVYNPKYVGKDDKHRLLIKILKDYHVEHPDADGVPFSAIKGILKSRYKIETGSAGLFFRRELKDWASRGGTKNKEVVLDLEKLHAATGKKRGTGRGKP